MRAVEQLAVVIQLALLTEDRDRSEQSALAAVAHRVDTERNAMSTSNPRLRDWLAELRLTDPELWPPCTYTLADDKGCKCRNLAEGRIGRLPAPPGGWSRLEAAVLGDFPIRPQRIRRQRVKGWRLPFGAIIVDRTSAFGNPFTLAMAYTAGAADSDQARNWCVNKYADWVEAKIGFEGDPDSARWWTLRRRLHELQGRDLACTCAHDGLACHGDWLIDFVNP